MSGMRPSEGILRAEVQKLLNDHQIGIEILTKNRPAAIRRRPVLLFVTFCTILVLPDSLESHIIEIRSQCRALP